MTVSANEEKRKRAFTPARIVALVLIGLLVLGLGYVRDSSGDSAVSVPSGVKAGYAAMPIQTAGSCASVGL